MTVGLISGGINTNVVPDKIVFRLDRRMVPEENPAEVEAELRAVIARAARRSPAGQGHGQPHPARRAADAAPAGAEADRGALPPREPRSWARRSPPRGVPLYTDARHYAKAGVPIVLYGAGPHTIEEANAHRADERLPLADLYQGDRGDRADAGGAAWGRDHRASGSLIHSVVFPTGATDAPLFAPPRKGAVGRNRAILSREDLTESGSRCAV